MELVKHPTIIVQEEIIISDSANEWCITAHLVLVAFYLTKPIIKCLIYCWKSHPTNNYITPDKPFR